MKKRILGICLILTLCLLLLGCSFHDAQSVMDVDATTPIVTDAPTSTPTDAPTPCPTYAPESSWEIDYYVDDFGDKTESAYLRGKFKGKYTNSFSRSEELTVFFYYDGKEKAFSIRLLEYGSYRATFTSIYEVYMKVKIDGNEYNIELEVPYSGGDVFFTSTEGAYNAIKSALIDGKEIKCVIKESLLNRTYNFTIDGVGFKETLAEAGMR